MQPHSKWDDLDFDLVNALDRLERDVSPATGLPWWLTRTGHPAVGFEVEVVEDAAEAALEKYDEQQRDKKKQRGGAHRFVVARSIEDGFSIEGGLAREAMLDYANEQSRADGEGDAAELAALGIEVNAKGGSYDASLYG